MSILSTSTSWVIDVSRCLGLVDLEPCLYETSLEPALPSAKPQQGASGLSSTKPPSSRHYRKFSAGSTAATKYSSTPCLGKTKGKFSSVGNLVDVYPGNGRELESACSTRNQNGDSAPSSPVIGVRKGKEQSSWRPSLSVSSSRLDCSVHYSDGTSSPSEEFTRRSSSDRLFSSARNTLVHRVCGATVGGSSAIGPRIYRRPRRGSKGGGGLIPPPNPPRGKIAVPLPLRRLSRSRSEGHLHQNADPEKPKKVPTSFDRSDSDSRLVLNDKLIRGGTRRKDCSSLLNLWIQLKFVSTERCYPLYFWTRINKRP